MTRPTTHIVKTCDTSYHGAGTSMPKMGAIFPRRPLSQRTGGVYLSPRDLSSRLAGIPRWTARSPGTLVCHETQARMTRLVCQLIGTLLVVGFMLKYWWLIALIVCAVVLYKRVPGWWAAHQAAEKAERARVAGIAARADAQHNQVMSGDERGLWGVAAPAMRKYERVSAPH